MVYRLIPSNEAGKREVIVKTFKVTLPRNYYDELNRLIEKGVFTSYAEAIRRAIELLIEVYGEKNKI